MALLTGAYNHQIDAKNRIRIPAKLKKELGDEYYFAFGTNSCIFVFAKDAMEKYLEELGATKLSDLQAQKRVRAFAKTCVAVEEDNQGRVVLSPELRKHAKIENDDKELVVCGAVNRVEIWNKRIYDEYFADVDDNFDDIFSQLDI
ncbi:MAG: division/cell wall cluster transcriptional repressor MraZ [Candidatus Coproplasma sp.]